MQLKKIEKLLERYFEAKTNTCEEILLKDYFSQPNVHSSLQVFLPLFQYLKAQSNISI